MKVLALNGSGRGEKGITNKLMTSFTSKLKKEDCKVDTIFIKDKQISSCSACMNCMYKTPGSCYIKDDMEELYALIQKADLLILATPIYIDSYSAQLKMVIDRCICCMEPFFTLDKDGRTRHAFCWKMPSQFLLISTSMFPESSTFLPLIETFRAQVKNFDSNNIGELCVPSSIMLQLNNNILKYYENQFELAAKDFINNGYVTHSVMQKIDNPPYSIREYTKTVEQYEQKCRLKIKRFSQTGDVPK